MFSVIFPGQGSQSVGMAKDLYNKFDIAKELFKEADSVLNLLNRSLFIPTDCEPWPGKITENIKNYNLNVVFCVVIK